MSDYWKKKMDELNQKSAKSTTKTTKKSSASSDYWGSRMNELNQSKKKKKKKDEDDIAPVRTTVTAPVKDKDEDKGFDFFQKGVFSDGYQFGDISKAILGTGVDVGTGVVKGAAKLGGGIVDAGTYGVAAIADKFGNEEYANELRVKAQENVIDKKFQKWDKEVGKYSLLGETGDAISEGLGQVGTVILTGGLAGAAGFGAVGATAATTGVMGASSIGSGMSEAYQSGATDEEAATYGLVKGVVDAGSELLFGGLGKAVKAVGLSRGLSSADDVLARKLSEKVTGHVTKSLVQYGVKASAEGVEEVIAGVGSVMAKQATYMDDKELSELLEDENLLEQFVVGAVTSGVAQSGIVPGMQTGSLKESIETGRDFVSGLSQNEQKVIDKVWKDRIAEAEKDGKLTNKQKDKLYNEVVRDMERGYIDTDTIEEVLGGDTYKSYKDTIDSEDALSKEYEELGNLKDPTLAQQTRYKELHEQMKVKDTTQRDQLKTKLGEEVMSLVQSDRLAESYNERSRRGQAFEADLSKYDTKQQSVIQKAIDSGILNNTNRTHEFVDLIAKISADKGVLFDFTNNQRLKDSGFAVDGKTVNGFVTKDGVTLNIDAAKSLNSVVGHEITHVLEGTELYTELQSVLKTYAESKGEYQSRYDALAKLYDGVEGANVDAELTADLVGDYLFTDSDFIHNLSTNNRNVFQKVYDEIKYLCKVATAGSKEARELEKVKRAFEKAYKADGDTKYSEVDTKYSVSDSSGKELTKEQQEFFKDSKARDSNGNLLKVYHGSKNSGFNVFRYSEDVQTGTDYGEAYYFTSDRQKASGYSYDVTKDERVAQYKKEKDALRDKFLQTRSEEDKNAFLNYKLDGKDLYDLMGDESYLTEGGEVKEVYLNLTNPLIVDAGGKYYYEVYPKYFEQARENGNDGIIVKNVIDNPRGEARPIDTYIAFRQNQIKRTDNTNPTGDKDIRYSLSDSEGRELSPAIQNRFGKSKVVDENGNLKAVYHGTATGEFSIFDKSKGSVEGDFGSGFYFTDNEADVSDHYEGGGPDFDNKVARLAEQIADEEDIDYDEAEEKAREQLFKGSHKFEVYLNIENPAIVGETMLMDNESYMEQYNEEDYEDYDDYLADVEQLLADDIENIVWEVEKNCDVDNTEGIAGILYDAYTEGGIDIEDLKSRLNELYLEDSEGNLVANEVARQIIESLGYDGIVDPTVSGKWNMDIEEGTTHYIVFKPNQIKAVTNQNPTDNPDIHRSLSANGNQPTRYGNYNVSGKDIALAPTVSEMESVQEATVAKNATTDSNLFPDDLAPMSEPIPGQFDSLTDADAPPEMDAPYYEDENSGEVGEVADPMEGRYIEDVGNQKVKAYMYENPEVKPFFQTEAAVMLNELENSTKGQKWYNDELYYESGGEQGWGGTKRDTSEDIAYLLDGSWSASGKGYTYDEIKKGLLAIIEDNGKENNACSKRIEFILNDRLREGYTDFLGGMGDFVPANEGYLKLLEEKQITEYNKEAFDALVDDVYAPPVEEAVDSGDIAPVAAHKVEQDEYSITEPYEAIRPKREKEPRMARATPAEQARAEILTEEPEVPKKQRSALSMIKNNVLDKGMVFEDLSLATGNRELQAKYNSTRYAESRAQRFMEQNLKPIVETVEKSGKVKQFYEYLYHMHNADRMTLEDRYADTENKPVFGYGVTADVSKDAASKLEQANPEFKQWAESIYAYNRLTREMLVDGGIISKEIAELWEDMYPHYVPVRRKGDEGLNINVPLDTGRTGVNAPIKRATGGNRDILPLFDTMAMRTEQTYKAIAKNRFGVELKNTLGTTIGNEAVSLDETIDSIDGQDSLLQEGKNGQKPTFTVFENGERVTFEITEEMYDAMKPKSKGLAYTNKTLNKLNNLRRGLLTEYNPAFMLTNPIKDTQDVLVNSQHPAKTYANYPKAIMELAGKKGHWYQEYMENGGEQNTYFDGETNTFVKEKSGLSKAIGFPLEKISEANNFIERIPRMAEYIASRKEGRSIDVSMLDAARVTTNFAAGGDLTKALNRNGFTFLNASVQGFMQNVRNFREAKANGLKGWATLAAKFAVAGLPSILLNHLMWEDDEEYEELSDYVKQNYYVVGKFGDGNFVRIPKGRTLAVIQNAFEQMENFVTGNDDVDLGTFVDLVMTNLAPSNPAENNLIAPIMQVAKNETWYGDDMVPSRLQNLPAAEQFDESTDSISKWLGEKLNYSPVKINYLLDQYSGAVGDMFLPMLTPEAERVDNTLLAPVTDKFTTDSVMKNQNVSDFYTKKDELTVAANSRNATEEDALRAKYMNSINSELAELYGQKREIQNSDLSNEEKYAQVRNIQNQIVELTKEGLGNYEDISYESARDGEYANIGNRYFKRDDDGEWQTLSDEQAIKYKVTSAAGDADYATDGENHYRWYVPEAGSDSEPGWRKITDKQLEKQEEVTTGLDISAADYWSNKEEYDYAYEYPDKYAVAKSVGGYEAYRGYSSELYDIKADKDENGKSISGSRKEKVLDYVNGLDADYGTKLILFKSEYPSYDDSNYEIIDYLNGRDDISGEEMATILKELGFTVSANGDISW